MSAWGEASLFFEYDYYLHFWFDALPPGILGAQEKKEELIRFLEGMSPYYIGTKFRNITIKSKVACRVYCRSHDMASGRIVLTQVIYLVPLVKFDIPSNSRLTLM